MLLIRSVTLALLAPQACVYGVVYFRQFCDLPRDAPPHLASFGANANPLEKPPVCIQALVLSHLCSFPLQL